MLTYLFIGILGGSLVTLIITLLVTRSVNRKKHDLESELSSLSRDNLRLNEDALSLKSQFENKTEEWISLSNEIAAKNQEINQLKTINEEKEKDLRESLEKMNREFKILANDLLEEKTKKLTDQNVERLKEILSPLKEQITGFEKRVDETYKSSLKDQSDLRAELKKLQDLNLRISDEANNLTRALKGDMKKQGNWGEVILERLLERSGLIRGEEYEIQVALQNDEGRRIQPDVVVYLPENKHLLVDSKVSLVAYEKLINEEVEEQKPLHLKEHITSIKRHIRELSEKNYSGAKGLQSPEFVLMFVPIESSFSLAVREDIELFNEAWDQKIVIVSPTTLLATMMTIASLWKQAKQTKHHQLIAEQGAKLFDKLKGFLDDFVKIGDRLKSAQQSFDEAEKKLQTGRGNLIKKAEDMKKLGIPTSQKLPDNFQNYEDQDETEAGDS